MLHGDFNVLNQLLLHDSQPNCVTKLENVTVIFQDTFFIGHLQQNYEHVILHKIS